MNGTPAAERLHIGFFGRRNAGKSSLVNAVTGQDLVIVSDVKGTTTDPVRKAMELLPIGPVLIIDTPGIDDEGALGNLRIIKAKQVLNMSDVAVLVIDAAEGAAPADNELISVFKEKNVPYLIAWNKCDIIEPSGANIPDNELFVSAKKGVNINAFKEKLAKTVKTDAAAARITGGLLSGGDIAVLVVPIDKAAPKGRLILPQQQTIRDILESDASAMVVKEHELRGALESLRVKPKIVITDSQVFAKVAADTPPDIPLTSFSILFARYKGFLWPAVNGVKRLDLLETGDKVLICEGCTHHRQCDDIGTVKLPRWIRAYTACEPEFEFKSGVEFPEDLSAYKMVIHCGACMNNEREMRFREKCAGDQNIPFTNYGIAIAHIQGILERCIAPFKMD
ncbi:MAG: [FeFe] hydrogenase H-cluster maturation GTPase HydF [Spirochaetaceae bacterium]|nr:[FeFe] hydrogenase H-cluster maturation GTPase HydF [Spirochaetaceae bacterium]